MICFYKLGNQVTNESAPFCIFPTKWKDYEWYSINGTIRMIVNNTDIQLTGLNKRLKCHETISLDKSIYTYRIQTYTNWYLFIKKNTRKFIISFLIQILVM